VYPPINRRGDDAYVLGMAKTMNAVAPSDAIRAVSVTTFRKRSAMASIAVASKH